MRLLPALLVLAAVPALARGPFQERTPVQARTPFQERCEAMLAAHGQAVSVRSEGGGGHRIDNTRSYRDLTRMKGAARHGSHVLGLTHTDSRVAIRLAGRMLTDTAGGLECVAPRIEVTLHYEPIMIYIGREFVPGSCAYREILAHEMRHLELYREQMPKIEDKVRAAMARRFGASPLYARAGGAQAMLRRELDTGWMPFVRRELARIEALQAAIDSADEYARLGKVCEGEVQSLIRKANRSTS